MFEIIPIARNTVFERIANGIMVTDKECLLLDCNEAAQRIFDMGGRNPIGKNLRQMLPELCATIDANTPFSEGSFLTFQNELRVAGDHGERFYNFAIKQSDSALREMEAENHALALSHLSRLKKILDFSEIDLRDFVQGNRDATYEWFALPCLLEKEANFFSLYCDIPVSLRISQEMRTFPFTVFQKMSLVRVTKEALNNIAKHAKASTVIIALEAVAGEIRFGIEDDGVGLDKGKLGQTAGAGLDIMEERALSLGGRRVIEAMPGGGTRLTLSFPLAGPGFMEAKPT